MRHNPVRYFTLCGLVLVGMGSVSSTLAAEGQDWPNVLSLEFALAQAQDNHPSMQLASADLNRARAELLSAQATNGLQSSLEGQLRWIDPPAIAYDQSQEDHRLRLVVSKQLYDFGRSSALEQAAESQLVGQQYLKRDAINQHRIAIMSAYFNVILADLENARNEEAMAGAFIRADRAADRNRLGQVSDIELLELRSEYQEVRERRYRSVALQRSTRYQLANILNRPDSVPSEIEMPELIDNARQLPAHVDEWISQAEQNNPVIKALLAQQESAQHRVKSGEAYNNPVITGSAEVAEYARESGSYDNWRAGITLTVPLLNGGRDKALKSRYTAELQAVKARLEQQRLSLRSELVELWNELGILKVSLDRANARIDYRNLYLDRSRALYELEVKADLGDAMTQTSDARLQQQQVRFATALAWARVDALLGNMVYDTMRDDQQQPDGAKEITQ